MAVDKDTAAAGDAGLTNGGGSKVFRMEEVAKHCTESDCWLAIDGKVYDVTKFLDDHPGGGEVLVTATGRDATDDFEDIGHSGDARKMLLDYYIGDVAPEDLAEKKAATSASADASKAQTGRRSQSGTSPFMVLLQVLVPLAILALAFAVRYLTDPSKQVKQE